MSVKVNKGINKNAGFTLLEVLIAASILIIVTGAAAGTAVMALNTGVFSKDRTVAQEQARKEIETIRVHIDTDAIDGDGDTEWSATRYYNWINTRGNYGLGRTVNIDNQVFTITEEAEYVGDDTNAGDNGNGNALDGCGSGGHTCYVDERLNMLKVTVKVTWEEAFWSGREKQVRLITYLTNNKEQ